MYDDNKWKIGDIIEFRADHIKPDTNRKAIITNINITKIYENNSVIIIEIDRSVLVRHGWEYRPTNEFSHRCALSEHAIKIGEVENKEILKVLYANK